MLSLPVQKSVCFGTDRRLRCETGRSKMRRCLLVGSKQVVEQGTVVNPQFHMHHPKFNISIALAKVAAG